MGLPIGGGLGTGVIGWIIPSQRRTSWKKRSRPFEAVPGGTRKQTGLPCETLLDMEPLLSVPQGQMASSVDEGRTPAHVCQGVSAITKRLYVIYIIAILSYGLSLKEPVRLILNGINMISAFT